jgi:hypothetical protein
MYNMLGVGIIGLSSYYLKNTYNSFDDINNRKNKLNNNIVDIGNICKINCHEPYLIKIDNKMPNTGILKLYENKTYRNITFSNDFKKININEEKFYDEILLKKINLNLGIKNFIPPKNIYNILFTNDNIINITSNSSIGMANLLKNSYHLDTDLIRNKYYSAKYYSLENCTVYAYGSNIINKDNDIAFEALIMGTNKKNVVDIIYAEEMNNVILNTIGGFFGIVLGILILCEKK